MSLECLNTPTWDRLFELALGQEGYITTQQAAEAGYSPQLLQKYIRNGRVTHVRRRIYRLVHFPASEHEDLAALWLWSERTAIFSHETALSLHQLSDVLPSRVHMTLPAAWAHRRLRISKGATVVFAEVPPKEQTWFGAVPATAPLRTLADCIDAHLSPELLEAALRQARARHLVDAAAVRQLRARMRHA